MAITAVGLGTNSEIGIGASGEVAPNGAFDVISGIFSSSMTISHDLIDTTNNDDAGFTTGAYGNTTLTLSLSFRYDPTDTGQGALRTAASVFSGANKVAKAFVVRPLNSSGEDSWSFQGVVTSFEATMDNNTPVDVSVEVQSIGAITYAAETS